MEISKLVLLVFVMIVVLIVAMSIINFLSRRKLKIRLATNWGKLWNAASVDNISSLNESLEIDSQRLDYDCFVDEQTWRDLDMQSIFDQINISQSSLGAEYLYSKLRLLSFTEDETLQTNLKWLETQPDERLTLQYIFARLGKQNNNFAKQMLLNVETDSKRHTLFYLILGLMPIISLLLFPIFRISMLIVFALSMVFNIIFYFVKKMISDREVANWAYLVQVSSLAKRISHINTPLQAQIKEILKHFKGLPFFAYTFSPKNDISEGGMLLEYANGFFMLPFIAVSYAVNHFRVYSDKVQDLLQLLGSLEAAISILNYEKAMPYSCQPMFDDGVKGAVATEIYHPLLKKPVSNPLDYVKNTLISGDNASGKSTYIKAVAINCILAQAIHLVLAKEFKMAHGQVLSSMTLADNLDSGFSYFIVESQAIKRMIEGLNDVHPTYLFLDEIFRGTNTVERIAAGASIMRWLTRQNCLYMISTHDVELIDLTKDYGCGFHFSGQFINGEVVYDYRLQQNSSTSRNALNILQTLNYPEEILDQAKSLIETFDLTRNWEMNE